MSKFLQRLLLIVGVIALVVLIVEIAFSLAATTHSSTAIKTIHINAGPYPLTVNFYRYPADAGYALPFSIAPQPGIAENLTFDISSIPQEGVIATPVHASISPDPATHGIQGNAEITVQGTWYLHIVVNGAQGQGSTDVPIEAIAPPPIPAWLGWAIGGLIPLGGLLLFLLLQRGQKSRPTVVNDAGSSVGPVTP